MKYCKSCKTDKPTEAFSKNKSKSDGLQTYCKACISERYAESARVTAKKWRENNPEEKKRRDLEYREKNRERLSESTRQWRKNNPEKRRQQSAADAHIRNARKRALPSEKIPLVEIFERDNWVCQLCGDPVDPELRWPHRLSATLDHVIPISNPSPDNPGHVRSNVQLAHYACNSSKGNRTVEDF